MSNIFDIVSMFLYIGASAVPKEKRMSFREKSAWISLLSYVGFYGYYFWVLSGVSRPATPRVSGSERCWSA